MTIVAFDILCVNRYVVDVVMTYLFWRQFECDFHLVPWCCRSRIYASISVLDYGKFFARK